MPNTANNQPIIPIEDFNMGGIADSKWSGIPNSLYRYVGFDPHSAPGILRVAQKMTKNSGLVVTDFCKARLASSNGRTYWGSSTNGNIYECDANGTWTLVFTVTAATGESKILDMIEHLGYIFIATSERLHRISATNAEGAAEWTANFEPDWASFSIADTLYHPMFILNLVLYIGSGSNIAQVDDNGTFSPSALVINNPLRVTTLGKMGVDLLIGTFVNDNITKTQIYRWNTYSDSFTVSDTIDEVGVNAFLEADNYTYVSCGVAGNLYYYDGEKLNLYKKIPGDYSPTRKSTVYPQAVGNIEGQILFGVSNTIGNPSDEGIFRIGRNSINYPYIMDLPYPISSRINSELVLSGVEIGGILVSGSDIYSSYRRSDAVTISISAPGVVTLTGHGLTDGESIIFSTTGTLPTGITAGTKYFIRGVDVNSFHLYDTSAHAIAGGATGRLDTTVSQSGVHTAMTVGIDKLDWSNKLSKAFFETRIISSEREKFTNFSRLLAAYASIPASTDILLEYSKNYGAYVTTTTKKDTDRNILYAENIGVNATTLQMRLTITASGNTAPEIESAAVTYR